MRCIRSQTDDPYFNLATEEYLLKNFSDAFYFQYVNRPVVVVGKHQNAVAEVDQTYLASNGILLARRISGGGAVYHDHGNMNYSFITSESPGDFIKFKKYTAPVLAALRELEVEAWLGSRNELLAGGKKISGTASHVFKTRVLHHGTLLYGTDLERLGRCLYVDVTRFKDKAVKSIRSEVVNIQDLLPDPPEAELFFQRVFDHIAAGSKENSVYELSRSDVRAIGELVEQKFSGWEWNFGYSPRFEMERTVPYAGGVAHFVVQVHKGVIEQVGIRMGGGDEAEFLSRVLTGARHERGEIRRIMKDQGIEPDIRDVVMNGMF